MNENQKFEFVTDLLWKLAKSNYLEGLSPTDKSISLSNSNDINIEIKQVNGLAELTASIARTYATISMPLSSLTSLLERLGLLDKKLESKLNFVFTEKTLYVKEPEAIKLIIEHEIDSTYPELKGNVTCQIDRDRDEVHLLLKKGFNDPDFRNAFPLLIMCKTFFKNCKVFGVKKIVFFDLTDNIFDEIDIDSYDISKLL